MTSSPRLGAARWSTRSGPPARGSARQPAGPTRCWAARPERKLTIRVRRQELTRTSWRASAPVIGAAQAGVPGGQPGLVILTGRTGWGRESFFPARRSLRNQSAIRLQHGERLCVGLLLRGVLRPGVNGTDNVVSGALRRLLDGRAPPRTIRSASETFFTSADHAAGTVPCASGFLGSTAWGRRQAPARPVTGRPSRVPLPVAGRGGARFAVAKVIMMPSAGRGWSWATAVTA